ncbi:MAG: site-specific integrase [Lachnospiraceae bacterium]|nr:site-specific integrase [Lachnospiraceae bacterium]
MPIYKIDGEKKNGLQKYRVRVAYQDNNGKTKQVERTCYGLSEAQLTEKQLLIDYKENHTAAPVKMTVNQLIAEYDKYHAQETKRTSHDTSMKNLRLRVAPYLGDVRLDKLTQAQMAKWKTTINEQDLSLTTKRNAYIALTGLINYALKMEYIPKNPLKPLGTFKDVNRGGSKKEMKFYTEEEFKRFIKCAENDCHTVDDWNYYVFFCVLFFMGVRKGEAYGLTWNDIEGNIMHVRRSVSQKVKDDDGSDYEDTPKTSTSERDILIPDQLVEILAAHKKRQQEAAPLQFNDNYRICGKGETPIRDTSVENHNKKYAKAAGLPHIRIHDYRHSHASFLINKNVNVVVISKRLGHASITETLNTYSHMYKSSEQEALDVLNELKI